MSVISRLANKHEEDIAELLDGVKSKASGSQWTNPADGRHSRHERTFAFAWDCKAAMPGTKSIGITREMLRKIESQCEGERPAIPLRFYLTESGRVEFDWVAINVHHLAEMMRYIEGLEDELENLR